MTSVGLRPLAVAVLLGTLAGCQSLSGLFGAGESQARPDTLGSLQPAPTIVETGQRTPVSLDQVIQDYEDLLPLLDDPARIVQVQHRLADLRFHQAEDRMVEAAQADLDVAIDAYQQLLEKYPDRKSNDQVLYQLAKAQDLNGDTQAHMATLDALVAGYPDSDFRIETQFRRGELLFTQGYYAEADEAFQSVIGLAQNSDDASDQRFVTDAWYMRGWCLFKLGDYDNSLVSYTRVLDRVMPEGQSPTAVDQRSQTLLNDLFRVMGLGFTQSGGADSLQALFEKVGSKPYEIVVYDRYSDLLVSKEQYSDAIDVYERYIALHPDSRWAPRYHIAIIDTLQKAGFTSTIVERKAAFVRDYSITGTYWQQASAEDRQYLLTELEPLLTELANRHYVIAQRVKKANKPEEARKEFQAAADYYAAFVATFPRHPDTPDMVFLLAETHVELQQWPQAIEAFERVAYGFGPQPKGAEAAYAGILTYQDYLKASADSSPEILASLKQREQQSRLRFVTGFPEDPRAIDILYIATQQDFEQQQYLDALAHAQQIIDWQPVPAETVLLDARLIKAHSLYRMGDYPFAEMAYQDALLRLPEDDTRRADVLENLAASVYKQAEAFLAAGDKAAAVDELLRVGEVAPTSALRANAEYDAANYLIEMKSWDRAVGVMAAFRTAYPQHAMIDTLPAKMALAYRETGQWEQAADESQRMVGLATTDDEKRDTLFITAQLYDRADNQQKAIRAYSDYANRYPEPLADYMDAADRLAVLYEDTGEPTQRRLWLQKQMDAVDRNPASADDRMRYQAAAASAVFADDAYRYFSALTITQPLQETLGAKISALEEAVAAYQKTADYGVSKFSTEAGYRIADLYAQLGTALMESERPDGLSELELSQYELLLEEQAYPFEDNAIAIHEQNAQRSWDGIYDEWVRNSFESLRSLLPGRYNKPELNAGIVENVY